MNTGPVRLYSIGYQGHTPETLVEELRRAGVLRVVDVRDSPWSPKPEWRRAAVEKLAREAGADYVHDPRLGNPKEIRDALREGRMTLELAAAAYRRHLGRTIGAHVFARIFRDGDCLLCACRDWRRCHRSLIFDRVRETSGRFRGDLICKHLPPRERHGDVRGQGAEAPGQLSLFDQNGGSQ